MLFSLRIFYFVANWPLSVHEGPLGIVDDEKDYFLFTKIPLFLLMRDYFQFIKIPLFLLMMKDYFLMVKIPMFL